MVPAQGKVMDYGCGTAHVLLQAARKRKDLDVYLVDIPEAITKDYAIWRFKKHGTRYTWLDIPENEQLIGVDGGLDFIRCHDVFEHTFHPDVVMNGFAAMLKLAGIVSFDFMDNDGDYNKEKTKQSMERREETLSIVRKIFDIFSDYGDSSWVVRKT
jgi:2-polyprenyl-3-methyl-5-hydroxy-6-metoxy-1,4-benzoquinol methylase